jgi:hypothetical protein
MGRVEVYDADLSGYFDSIPHEQLMVELQRRIKGEPLIGNIVQPPAFAADIDARFIAMYQRRCYQLFFEP